MADIVNVEEKRLKLEANIERLRKGLRHWQHWDAEYEGLKEELDNLPRTASGDRMLAAWKDYASDILNERELRELIFTTVGVARNRSDVIKRINDRQSYVTQNIKTLERQLMSEIEQLDKLASSKKAGNETADSSILPLSEIIEELDDEDNIISGKVTRPGESTHEVLDLLEKAGVKEVPDASPSHDPSTPSMESVNKSAGAAASNSEKIELPLRPKVGQDSKCEASTSEGEGQSRDRTTIVSAKKAMKDAKRPSPKKSVSFAKNVKPGDTSEAHHLETAKKKAKAPKKSVSFASEVDVAPSVNAYPSAIVNDKIDAHRNLQPGEKLIELDEDDKMVHSTPVMPDGESDDDARLRREMIEYGLNEIGPIVAELDLEEADSEEPGSSDEQHAETDLTDLDDDEDEDEDQYGRSKGRALSNDYHSDMQALKARLEAQYNALGDSSKPSGNGETQSLSDDVVSPPINHSSKPDSGDVEAATNVDAGQPQEDFEPPETILSDNVVERAGNARKRISAAPDDWDEALHAQEIRTAYQAMRTSRIQQQGGFLKRDEKEEEEGPLVEERDGRVKKVSRFKAARLGHG